MEKLDTQKNLDIIWNALAALREDLIPEGDPLYDAQWNEICEAMAYLAEDLGIEEQTD
jgi:hypothetical protein